MIIPSIVFCRSSQCEKNLSKLLSDFRSTGFMLVCFLTLRYSVRRLLTKDSRGEAMFAHANVASTSQTHLVQKKHSRALLLNANMIGCSEENQTSTKITSTAVDAVRGVTSVLMAVRVFTL